MLSEEDLQRVQSLEKALEEAFGMTCEQMGVIISIDNAYRLKPTTNKLMLHLYRTNVYIRERKRSRGIHLEKAISVIERHRGYRRRIKCENLNTRSVTSLCTLAPVQTG